MKQAERNKYDSEREKSACLGYVRTEIRTGGTGSDWQNDQSLELLDQGFPKLKGVKQKPR